MQMHSSETVAGMTICRAPSMNRGFDLLLLLELPVDVLDRHRGVVDQDADGERQAAKRHDVDIFAGRGQQSDRGQDGQGNRDDDDDGRTPAAEKNQDQQAGQRRRERALENHRRDRGLTKAD